MKKLIYFLLFVGLVLISILLFHNTDIVDLEKMSYIATIVACVIGAMSIPFAISQIKEIKNDRVLSQKPILCVNEVKIKCCKPEILRSPDFSEVFIGHRIDIQYNLNNLGDSSALDIDISSALKIHNSLNKEVYKKFDKTDKIFIKKRKGITIFERSCINISLLKTNDKKEMRTKNCLFNEVTKDFFLESLLRKMRDLQRPKIEFVVYYKNLTGGYFKYKTEFEIIASKNKDKVIEFIKIINNSENKNLKTIKENINLLKIGKDNEFFEIFSKNVDEFDEQYKDIEDIELILEEIPGTLSISNVTRTEYMNHKRNMHYGILIDA